MSTRSLNHLTATVPLCCALLAGLLVAGACGPSAPVDKPELLLITVEGLRRDALLDAAGEVRGATMRRLAAQGTSFAEAYAQTPLSVPSLATIMTGTCPQVHGCRQAKDTLGEDRLTLAEVLVRQGYRTAAFLGGAPAEGSGCGLEQGFGTVKVSSKPQRGLGWKGGVIGRLLGKGEEAPALRRLDDEDALEQAQRSLEEAGRWLAEGPAPRFLWLHFGDPWGSSPKPGRTLELEPQDYYRAVSALDKVLGRWLQSGAGTPFLERGMVILAGAHGRNLGEAGGFGHGGDLMDFSINVPLCIAAPGYLPAGNTVSTQVRLLDIFPTVVEFVSGNKAGSALEGLSLADAVPPGAPDRPAIAETLALSPAHGPVRLWAVRLPPYKLLKRGLAAPQLYEVRTDPTEDLDIASREPETTARLSALLAPFLAQEALGSPPLERRVQPQRLKGR